MLGTWYRVYLHIVRQDAYYQVLVPGGSTTITVTITLIVTQTLTLTSHEEGML